ncbi:hypothetical protein [Phenylobacterium kunshanense]|uniref:Uncharacterized protein n=1 Tax=Phenylobacterium kunshanense TaxID=1445034 RepID=A0A328BQK4_9CAUL|nr:hypothetical protein [Phenylobacterium kunshanense]RAK68781.1 hypothetical protein DJ019_01860 [Phenylobacterium kunshanense]
MRRPFVPGFVTAGEAADSAVSEIAIRMAARALVDRDIQYDGQNIIIPTGSHAEALRLVRELRAALGRAA